MQIQAQEFLPIVEAANKILIFDIEASGTRGDYNSILCASFLPIKGSPTTVCVERPGDDKLVVKVIREHMQEYSLWVSFYGKGFDVPMIQTRLLVHGLPQLEKRHHLDMYYVLKSRILTARRSQAHLLRLLETQEQKMDVSPDVWNRVLADPQKELPLMRRRCESDVKGLRDLYNKTKHLIVEIQK